jgi:hypothetical protein
MASIVEAIIASILSMGLLFVIMLFLALIIKGIKVVNTWK